MKLLEKCLRKFRRGGGNLVSLDNPYQAIGRLLPRHRVHGILDAGASHGRVAYRLLRLFPEATVHAFEPQPIYRDVLTKQARQDVRFKPEFVALGDQETTLDLRITRSPGTTSLFSPSRLLRDAYPSETQIEKTLQVEVTTIDAWAARNAGASIELMKFDIQGGELMALQGAAKVLSSTTLLVYTEILFNRLYEGGAIYSEVDQFLRSCGFVLYDIYKPRYEGHGQLMWGNAIFVHGDRLPTS